MGPIGARQIRVASLLDAMQEALSGITSGEHPKKMLTDLQLLHLDLENLISELTAEALDETDQKELIDRHVFNRLIEIAGPDVVPELLFQLVKDLTQIETQLPVLVSTKNWEAIRSNSHVLIALSGSVGANRLNELASSLNSCAHSQDLSEVQKVSLELQSHLVDLIAFIALEIDDRGLIESSFDQKSENGMKAT